MTATIVIGVIGAGDNADPIDVETAFALGRRLAERGWVVLSGGRAVGVMDAVSKGAKAAGGLTVGVLPSADRGEMSEAVDIPILTGMGAARNNINVLSSDVVIACGAGGGGTVSEIALAFKAGKPVILLSADELARSFFRRLGGDLLHSAESPEDAVRLVERLLVSRSGSGLPRSPA